MIPLITCYGKIVKDLLAVGRNPIVLLSNIPVRFWPLDMTRVMTCEKLQLGVWGSGGCVGG